MSTDCGRAFIFRLRAEANQPMCKILRHLSGYWQAGPQCRQPLCQLPRPALKREGTDQGQAHEWIERPPVRFVFCFNTHRSLKNRSEPSDMIHIAPMNPHQIPFGKPPSCLVASTYATVCINWTQLSSSGCAAVHLRIPPLVRPPVAPRAGIGPMTEQIS
jgi:hypothetical protein